MPPELLEVGAIVRPHGLRGEVVVALVSNRPERLAAGARFVARRLRGAGDDFALEIESARPFQHRYLVRLVGVGTREAAEDLRGVALFGEPLEDPEALFVHELIGATVVERDGTVRGVVTAVEANPASDLLVIGASGALVPLRFVVDRSGDRLVVDAPPGLFE